MDRLSRRDGGPGGSQSAPKSTSPTADKGFKVEKGSISQFLGGRVPPPAPRRYLSGYAVARSRSGQLEHPHSRSAVEVLDFWHEGREARRLRATVVHADGNVLLALHSVGKSVRWSARRSDAFPKAVCPSGQSQARKYRSIEPLKITPPAVSSVPVRPPPPQVNHLASSVPVAHIPPKGLTLCLELKLRSTRGSSHWGQGPESGCGRDISARVAALYTNHASTIELCITSSFCIAGRRCPRWSGAYGYRTPTHPAGNRCRSDRSTKRRWSPCHRGSRWV